jgi:glycosyltransferase involved in cell wall biosynthesis
LAQGAYATEIIVVDDGSTDDTREVCASYGNQIEYVWQKNAGASAARNTGVNHARHPWVAFLDSDDYWTPAHLEKMVAAIKATSGQANFYFCDMQMGEGKNAVTLWQKFNFAPPESIQLAADGTNWAFLKRQPMMLQCAVFRKDAWQAFGGLEPRFRLVHDTDIFFHLSAGSRICAVGGVGCIQTDDDVSAVRLTTAVHSRDTAYWKESVGMWEKILEKLPDLREPYRKLARVNLAAAHWRLVRLDWSSGQHRRSLRHLPQIFSADPGFLLSLLVHRRSDVSAPVVSPEY